MQRPFVAATITSAQLHYPEILMSAILKSNFFIFARRFQICDGLGKE